MKRALLFAALATLVACTEAPVDQAATPEPILVAVLPDQSKDTLLSQYTPLLDYLESATSLKFELSIPADYSDLLDQFDAGRVHLAWFGGLTFTQAERGSGAVPLVFRDVDLQFTSCYLAKSSDQRKSINEFEGEAFAFGPYLSTSGHLMPRYFLQNEGLDPDEFFASILHSEAHDETAKWVAEGVVALGVVNCVIVQSLFDNGILNSGDVRIVETTPPYSDYVWAVSNSLDEGVRLALLDAFLALDASDSEHRKILRDQGANAYLPASSDDFEIVRVAAKQARLFPEGHEN